MENQQDKVLETLNSPGLVQQGDLDTLLAAKYYPKTPLTKKFLVVIYKEINEKDGFILTAYFTRELSKKRELIWKS